MRGKKITEEQKEKVKAVIYLNPELNHSGIARQTGIPESTLHGLLKDETFLDKDKYEEARNIKKQEFINNAWEVVQKALLLTNKRFTKALDDEDAIEQLISVVQDHDLTVAEKKTLVTRLNGLQMNNIRDIAITLGTIYDKQALASGEPTTITQSSKSIPELVKDTEDMLQEIKQLTGS